MATRMQQRRGTAAEWASVNPILTDGEMGFARDTKQIKVGDGVTPWNDLPVEQLGKLLFDAKGDILIGSADNTVVRQAVGSNGTVLTADSTKPSGVVWAPPAMGFAELFLHGGN